MIRAQDRTVVVPDALMSPSSKPGPAERKSESYVELTAALREQQMLSEWTPINHGSNVAELQLREALTRTLSEHAYFGYVRDDSKLPHSHPKKKRGGTRYIPVTASGSTQFEKPNGSEWLGSLTAPRSGNWSVIPRMGSRLYVLDFDVTQLKRDSEDAEKDYDIISKKERRKEVRQSIKLMEDFLGFSLKNTYAQLSPSGGVHVFLLLPEGVDPKELPSSKISNGMKSLAGVPEEQWETTLKGDIRSGASNGFILMAGSITWTHYRPIVTSRHWSDFKDYRNGRKLRLAELSASAVERLREAKKLDLELKELKLKEKREEKLASSKKKALSTDNAEESSAASSTAPLSANRRKLAPGSSSKLLETLAAKTLSFHAGRAYIYRALSCCVTVDSIADLCVEAGYARDTYRARELSRDELIADIYAMHSRGLTSSRCGAHCRGWAAKPVEKSTSELPTEESSASSADLFAADMLANRLSALAGAELTSAERKRLENSVAVESRVLRNRDRQRASEYGVYESRDPRGMNYSAVAMELIGRENFSKLLSGSSLSLAGYRLRALELAVGYFAPLFSAGASVAIAPMIELRKLFGWTESQVREALRLLRATDVVVVERRQITGRAAGYSLGHKRFEDATLSKRLKSTWGGSVVKNVSGERAFLGGGFDYARGRIVRPDGSSYSDSYLREVGGSFAGLLLELGISLTRAQEVGNAVVSRYLSKSFVRYARIALTADNSADKTLKDLRKEATVSSGVLSVDSLSGESLSSSSSTVSSSTSSSVTVEIVSEKAVKLWSDRERLNVEIATVAKNFESTSTSAGSSRKDSTVLLYDSHFDSEGSRAHVEGSRARSEKKRGDRSPPSSSSYPDSHLISASSSSQQKAAYSTVYRDAYSSSESGSPPRVALSALKSESLKSKDLDYLEPQALLELLNY